MAGLLRHGVNLLGHIVLPLAAQLGDGDELLVFLSHLVDGAGHGGDISHHLLYCRRRLDDIRRLVLNEAVQLANALHAGLEDSLYTTHSLILLTDLLSHVLNADGNLLGGACSRLGQAGECVGAFSDVVAGLPHAQDDLMLGVDELVHLGAHGANLVVIQYLDAVGQV